LIRSDGLDLAVLHLDDLLAQLLLARLFMVERAGVVLGQTMAVAVEESATAFDSQESELTAASRASIFVHLLSLILLFLFLGLHCNHSNLNWR
jgi:hypothetical protein